MDEVVCLETPESFFAVGQWYVDFSPTTDEEVRELLSNSTTQTDGADVSIPAGEVSLKGSSSCRRTRRASSCSPTARAASHHSPRNQLVAERLRARGLATLLTDSLTQDEEERERFTGALRFDIDLLARASHRGHRLAGQAAVDPRFAVGYFGASTGAAAALVAAAKGSKGSTRSCREVAGRTWPVPFFLPCKHRHCSSSGARTRWSGAEL